MLTFTTRDVIQTLLLFPIALAALWLASGTGESAFSWRYALTTATLVTLARFVMLLFEHRRQEKNRAGAQ